MLRLIALVLPLGLDTFAVSAALGIAGLPPDRRLRVSAVFIAFEVAMPLAGVMAGVAAGHLLGGVAEYVALGALAAVGVYMLLETDPGVALLTRSRGAALLGLGLSLSIDELAIGFSLGLLGVAVVAAVAPDRGAGFRPLPDRPPAGRSGRRAVSTGGREVGGSRADRPCGCASPNAANRGVVLGAEHRFGTRNTVAPTEVDIHTC